MPVTDGGDYYSGSERHHISEGTKKSFYLYYCDGRVLSTATSLTYRENIRWRVF